MRNSFLERQEARSREVREGKNGGRFTVDGLRRMENILPLKEVRREKLEGSE
jgi:hypothetical protein